ncbi:MAG: hypothetical protein ABH983_00505, partial [Candidatus Micrarchaeota archaeon]
FFSSFVTGLLKWPGLTKLFGTSIYQLVPNISTLHDWSGLIMGLLVLVHLILHWNWIVSVTKSILKNKGEKKCKD